RRSVAVWILRRACAGEVSELLVDQAGSMRAVFFFQAGDGIRDFHVTRVQTCALPISRDVMAEGFPDRMKEERKTAVDALYEANRLGQKNGKGFYAYETDNRGKPKKVADESVKE